MRIGRAGRAPPLASIVAFPLLAIGWLAVCGRGARPDVVRKWPLWRGLWNGNSRLLEQRFSLRTNSLVDATAQKV
jgi:hypothetical protein